MTIAFILLSVDFLTLSSEKISLSTAYAIWTAVGTIGTVLLSVKLFKEVISLYKMISMFFIVIGVIGLKLSNYKEA
ncbi:DMT family transporter [Fusibacter sp. JL298sf-3]